MLRAEDPLDDGQQRGELVAGPGRIPRLPGPAGQAVAGGQGARVFRAGHPLDDGQQRGVLVAGPGRIPRLPGPAGQVAASGQGLRVLRAVGVILAVTAGNQRGLDLLYKRAQVSLRVRVFLQQVRQPPSPPLRQRGAGLLQICALRSGELLACLSQPPLRQLFLLRVAAAEQPGEPLPGRLPRVGGSSGHHRVAGQRSQRHKVSASISAPLLRPLVT